MSARKTDKWTHGIGPSSASPRTRGAAGKAPSAAATRPSHSTAGRIASGPPDSSRKRSSAGRRCRRCHRPLISCGWRSNLARRAACASRPRQMHRWRSSTNVLPSPVVFRRRCPVELTMFAPPCAALAIFAAMVERAERARDHWRCNDWRKACGAVAIGCVGRSLFTINDIDEGFLASRICPDRQVNQWVARADRRLIGETVLVNSGTRTSFLIDGEAPILRERDTIAAETTRRRSGSISRFRLRI